MNDYRKQIIVNPKFQLSFVAGLLTLTVLVFGLFYLGNIYFLEKLSEFGRHMNFPVGHPFYTHLEEHKSIMEGMMSLIITINLILTISFGMVFSNKIAGPLYRFSKEMKVFAQNKKAEKVFPRKDDYFLELFESYNEMYDSVLQSKQIQIEEENRLSNKKKAA